MLIEAEGSWSGPLFAEGDLKRLHRLYGSLPDWAQPSVAVAATSAAKAEHRSWLEEQVTRLSPVERADFLPRLKSAEQYAQSVAELALGDVLATSASRVRHSPTIGHLTPDLVATVEGGHEVAFEVWTRCIPPEVSTQRRHWGLLASRIATIGVPVLLAVDAAPRPATEPPASAELGPMLASLRRWLSSGEYRVQRTLELNGFRFIAMRDADGAQAQMVPVIPSTHADSRHVWDSINAKVSRYRRLVNTEGLPFVVALSAEPGTGLDRGLVEGALKGNNTMSLTFSVGTFGPIAPRQVEMRRTNAPPVFDPCLSAVAWIEFPGARGSHLSVWPIAGASRPIPTMEGPEITHSALD